MTSTTLEYRDGDVRLKGVLVRDGKRTAGPAIVLFPDARGVGAHAIECAERLAALGYPTLSLTCTAKVCWRATWRKPAS